MKQTLMHALLGLCLLAAPTQAFPLIELAEEAQQDARSGAFKELNQIESILKGMVEIRELELKRPVQINTLNREQLQTNLIAQIERDIPPERIAAEEQLYKHLGLLTPDFDYRQFLIELYTEQIGGYYDPKTQELRLIKGAAMTGLEQQMLIAHELTHALQDQHFELTQYLDPNNHNDDQTLAHMALIEGDAMVAATEYIQQRASQRPVLGIFEAFGSLLSAVRMTQNSAKFMAAPAFIKASMLFPYEQGSQFVSQFRQQGWSWPDLAEIYQNPPQSTTHIFHPSTYLNQISPLPVEISLSSYLPHSRLVQQNVMGELGYRQYFNQYLDWRQARAALQGWRGDRYEIQDTAQGPLFLFASIWQRPADASRFKQAWQQSLEKRDGSLNEIEPGIYQSPVQRVYMRQYRGAVLVIENLPEKTPWLPALRAAWERQVEQQTQAEMLSVN